MSNQVQLAIERLQALPTDQRAFLFMNVSALHQPNCFYVPDANVDSPRTQQAALAYVDSCLPALWRRCVNAVGLFASLPATMAQPTVKTVSPAIAWRILWYGMYPTHNFG